MSGRPSPVTSPASMSSQPSCWTGYVGAATSPAPVSEKMVTVSVPHPIPATCGRPALSNTPIAILWLSTLGTKSRGRQRAVRGLREQLDAQPGQSDDDVGATIPVHVSDIDGLRPIRIRTGSRVEDGGGERAVRQAREHEQAEVRGGVVEARGQDDVGDAVARHVADGDRLGLRAHGGDLVRPELRRRGNRTRRHHREQRRCERERCQQDRESSRDAAVTLRKPPHAHSTRTPIPVPRPGDPPLTMYDSRGPAGSLQPAWRCPPAPVSTARLVERANGSRQRTSVKRAKSVSAEMISTPC